MDLKEIMAISGKPGLFQLVAQSKNGIVVESLLDGKRFTAFAHERISSLEEISVYTSDEELALKEILKRMHEKHEGGEALVSKSDKNALRAYFEEVVPEHDQERVYTSDIKKMISWYNLLVEKEMLDFTEEETETTADAEEVADAEEKVESIADETGDTDQESEKTQAE